MFDLFLSIVLAHDGGAAGTGPTTTLHLLLEELKICVLCTKCKSCTEKKERPEEKEEEVYKVKVKSEKIEEAKNRRRLKRIFFKKKFRNFFKIVILKDSSTSGYPVQPVSSECTYLEFSYGLTFTLIMVNLP